MKHPNDHYYLVEVQYLGFRYHGWQRQPEVKTVQGMIEKTVNFILEDRPFKVFVTSRTDAMVSANQSAFQLILREEVDRDEFLLQLNENLPLDIRVLSVKKIGADFNIIQGAKSKEYVYLFCFGEKYHPFCAPYMAYIKGDMNIPSMKEAAERFVGEHNFKTFCENTKPKAQFIRQIDSCIITRNTEVTASFFPNESYQIKITGKGFLRYQVRFMVGALFSIGAGTLSITEIEKALAGEHDKPISLKAPASGLTLNEVNFE